MSISVLTEAITFVRNHPEMFFSGGTPNPLSCAQHLAAEALALGVPDVTIKHQGDWWSVSSSKDWFLADRGVEEQFSQLIALPEMGANASRVEIVLTAFADCVITRGADLIWRVMSGEIDSRMEQEKHDPTISARVVAFQFARSCS